MRCVLLSMCFALPAWAQQPVPVPVPVPVPPEAPESEAPPPPPAAPPTAAAPVSAEPVQVVPAPVITIKTEPVKTPKPKAPEPEPKGEVEIGVHLFGMAIGSFMTEVPNEDKFVLHQGNRVQVVYPGFGGFGGGGGLALDVTWAGIVGVQLGVFGSKEGGTGKINDVEFEITQTALHLPIYLRAAIPTDSVRPFIYVGPEFVLPSDPEVSEDVPGGVRVTAIADAYTTFAFGFGFEFMIPTEGIDARIPFTLRGSYNPGVPSGLDGRATYEIDGNILRGVEFKTEWEFQAAVSLGIAFYFHPAGGGADPAAK